MLLKPAFLCVAYALIIAMAKVNGDGKYKLSKRRGLKQRVEELLRLSGINLTKCGALKEIEQFQNYLSNYKIIVYVGLRLNTVTFEGNSHSKKTLLRTSKLLRPRSIYVTRVKHHTTLHTSVTKHAPCVRRNHPVRNIIRSIVVRETGGSLVRNVFRITLPST